MNALVEALTKRLGEWWPVTLMAAGLPHVIVAAYVVLAGHAHMFDVAYATDRVAEELRHRTPTIAGTAASLLTLLLVSIGAALLAQGLSRLAQRIWFSPWPWGLRWYKSKRIATRRRRWEDLATQHQQTSLRAESTRLERDADEARDRGRQRNRIAYAPPARATWMGDRLAAVEARVRETYCLDLEFAWPRLWLAIDEHDRAQLSGTRTRVNRDTTLTGWGLLYGALSLWWLPALPVGVAMALVAWRRARESVSQLAHLVEATVDLHVRDLAAQTGLLPAESHELNTTTGTQLTSLFRKKA